MKGFRLDNFLSCLGAFLLTSSCIPAAAPGWWNAAGTKIYVDTPFIQNDWAPVNAGQLKNMAVKAKAYLDGIVPQYGGAGSEITALCQFTQQGNWTPVNAGQLKNVAKAFHDRLRRLNYNWSTGGYGGTPPSPYPWSVVAPIENTAPVNIGQLKNLFSFEFTPSFLSDLQTRDSEDPDFDDILNEQEYCDGTDPNLRDTDGDGSCDDEEALQSTNPLLASSAPVALARASVYGSMSLTSSAGTSYSLYTESPIGTAPVHTIPAGSGWPPLDSLGAILDGFLAGMSTSDSEEGFGTGDLAQTSVRPPDVEAMGFLTHHRLWVRGPKAATAQRFRLEITGRRDRRKVRGGVELLDQPTPEIDYVGFLTIPANSNWSNSHDVKTSFQTTATNLLTNQIYYELNSGDPWYNNIEVYERVRVENVSLTPVPVADFITPAGDPVGSPIGAGISGSIPDGANEFTFNDASPGVLRLKLKVRLFGAGSLSPAEQALYKFELDPIETSSFAWNVSNPNGQPIASGDFLTAEASFTGLPTTNLQFGRKVARLKKGSELVAKADYEVFFLRDAINHPGGQVNSPNWFHYWKQLAPDHKLEYGGFNTDPPRGYTAKVRAMTEWDYTTVLDKEMITIYSQAIFPGNQYGVGKYFTGIDAVLALITHESVHVEQIRRADANLYLNGVQGTIWQRGWSFNKPFRNHWHLSDPNGHYAWDGLPGVAGVDDDLDDEVDNIHWDKLGEIRGPESVTGDMNLSHPQTASPDWPHSQSPPTTDTVPRNEEETEAVDLADLLHSEHMYGRDDWADPGKNHRTINEWND